MTSKNNIKKRIFDILSNPFSHTYTQHRPNYNFIVTLGIIIIFGFLILSSASSVQSFQKFGDSYWYLRHQFLHGFLPGLALFLFASRFDYKKWKKYAFFMLIATIVLLIMVFIPGIGVSYDKAKSWIALGPLNFQPTEIIKFTFLVYLATWLENKGARGLKDVQYGLLPFLFTLGVITLLILAQPDMGTLLIIITLSVIVYFVAGAPWKHLLSIIVIGFIVLFIAVQVAPYRLARFSSFINPEIDPQGISYHINQAKIAIGSGGILGLGIGKSRQKFHYLPEVSGDSIFAILAEELGLVFSILLLGLFLNFTIQGFKIARGSFDEFGKLLATGIISWISFQALINIGAMVGILPLTGLPLPFISAGGSSIATALFACGVIVNISKQTTSR